MVTYGDGLSDINVAELVDFHNKHKKTITISGVKPPSRFGEIIEKNSKVLSLRKSLKSLSSLINGGFMVFNKNLFEYLTDDDHCDFEFNALEKLSAVGK